jgi:putative FmdB family regulatory protein
VPLYEYQCEKCGRFEIIRKFSDAPLSICPTCGREVQKLLSAPAIQFKGTGWYITDYARKSSGADATTKDGTTKDGAAKTDAPKTDAAKTGADGAASATDSGSATASKTTSKDSATGGAPTK